MYKLFELLIKLITSSKDWLLDNLYSTSFDKRGENPASWFVRDIFLSIIGFSKGFCLSSWGSTMLNNAPGCIVLLLFW